MTECECHPWTDAMDEFLMAFWGNISTAVMMAVLEVTAGELNTQRYRLNIGDEGFLTEENINKIQDYRDACSMWTLAHKFGISELTLQLAYHAFDLAAELETDDESDEIPIRGVYKYHEKKYVKDALKAGVTPQNIAIWLNREIDDAAALIHAVIKKVKKSNGSK